MKRLFVACFLAGALAGILQSSCEAGTWEAADTTDLVLAGDPFWRFVDCDGDGLPDLLTIGERGIACRLQRRGKPWTDPIPRPIDASFVAFDVADSFLQHRAAVLLVARDSLVVLGCRGDSWMPVSRCAIAMPYARGGEAPGRFPFALTGGDRTRAFAIPTVDSVLVLTAGGRCAVRRPAATRIRGRRSSVETPEIRLAHWNADGIPDLVFVEETRVVVHAGIDSGFSRAPTTVSFREEVPGNGDGRPSRVPSDDIDIVPGDLDGDGLLDLVVTGAPRDPLESWFSIAVHGNRGDGCGPVADEVILIDAWGRLQPIGDRNGDGLADIRVQTAETGLGSLVRAITTSSTPVRTRLYTRSAAGPFVHEPDGDVTVRASIDERNRAPVLFDDGTDWNRDGAPDMLVCADGVARLRQTTAGRPGSMRETVRWELPGLRHDDYAITDVNGDGVIDFVSAREGSGPRSGSRVRTLRIEYGAVR